MLVGWGRQTDLDGQRMDREGNTPGTNFTKVLIGLGTYVVPNRP